MKKAQVEKSISKYQKDRENALNVWKKGREPSDELFLKTLVGVCLAEVVNDSNGIARVVSMHSIFQVKSKVKMETVSRFSDVISIRSTAPYVPLEVVKVVSQEEYNAFKTDVASVFSLVIGS